MRPTSTLRERASRALLGPDVPLLESADLPGDADWALPGEYVHDDDAPDDDRYGSLVVARSFDD